MKSELKIQIVNLVKFNLKLILEFNLKNKKGQGLNILTPDQMLSRLPTTLA